MADTIRCVCGNQLDDGFSIACDQCSRWVHAACFGILDPKNVPDVWKCWVCSRSRKPRRQRPPDDEPATHAYVPITADDVPDAEVRLRLRQYGQAWRGLCALNTNTPPASKTALRPTTDDDDGVRPPGYRLHASQGIKQNELLAPLRSRIVPSSVYLLDSLNGYAHLGMPKPFVHLIGPPLDLALDARICGSDARFARSGCRPNAIVRPCLDPDSSSLTFGVFALRDLKPGEEVVLGWEWDDANVVHSLPTVIQSPTLFPPSHIHRLRHQLSNFLHALSSTYTTCACGVNATHCALTQIAAFVDAANPHPSDLGPLVGTQRGFRTRERLVSASGIGGVEMVHPPEPDPPPDEHCIPPKLRKQWKRLRPPRSPQLPHPLPRPPQSPPRLLHSPPPPLVPLSRPPHSSPPPPSSHSPPPPPHSPSHSPSRTPLSPASTAITTPASSDFSPLFTPHPSSVPDKKVKMSLKDFAARKRRQRAEDREEGELVEDFKTPELSTVLSSFDPTSDDAPRPRTFFGWSQADTTPDSNEKQRRAEQEWLDTQRKERERLEAVRHDLVLQDLQPIKSDFPFVNSSSGKLIPVPTGPRSSSSSTSTSSSTRKGPPCAPAAMRSTGR